MSAYMVNRNCIRFLVSAAQSKVLNPGHSGPFTWNWGKADTASGYNHGSLSCSDRDEASRVGQMLWDENKKSICFRYPDCVGHPERMPGPNQESFEYAHGRSWMGQMNPVEVLKTCNHYMYQACEHDEWPESEAHAFIVALKESAICVLPGYDEAEWGAPKESVVA